MLLCVQTYTYVIKPSDIKGDSYALMPSLASVCCLLTFAAAHFCCAAAHFCVSVCCLLTFAAAHFCCAAVHSCFVSLWGCVQTYTYDIKPIKDNSRTEHKLVMLGSTASSDAPGITASIATTDSSDNIHSYEVRPHAPCASPIFTCNH